MDFFELYNTNLISTRQRVNCCLTLFFVVNFVLFILVYILVYIFNSEVE